MHKHIFNAEPISSDPPRTFPLSPPPLQPYVLWHQRPCRQHPGPSVRGQETQYVRTYAGSLINCCVLSRICCTARGGPGGGGKGGGPGAPGPYEIVPGPRAPVAGPVGDPRSGRRSSRPRSGRSRTCESHANIFSTYVNAVLPKGWAGEPPISKTRSWITTVPQEPLTENGCSPGRAGDGGPKPRGWGMGAAMIFLRTSSHWRQWRSTTRAA